MKLARFGTPILAVLSLSGCWNGRSQFREFMDEGHARHVPLIVYDISANDPHHLYPEPFAIGFLNTQDQEIASVTLGIATCGIKAAAENPRTISLGGPFEPHASFVISPVGPADSSGEQYRMTSSHILITSIVVVDASGTRKFEGKDVAAFLDARIANFCAGDII